MYILLNYSQLNKNNIIQSLTRRGRINKAYIFSVTATVMQKSGICLCKIIRKACTSQSIDFILYEIGRYFMIAKSV